jgi:putative heme-binding domain-containing protein
LGSVTPSELVKHLANDNPWWRRNAQRLLVDRKPPEAVPLLSEMAGSHALPVARVHALWTLDGLGALKAEQIDKALQDSSPGVRENAIRLAEPRIAKDAGLLKRLLAMESDADPRVRFQLLCTLGFVSTPASQQVRDRLLASGIDDKWLQAAALSASPEEATRLLPIASRQGAPDSFIRQAAAVIGARHRSAEMQRLLAGADSASALEGLAAGLRGRKAEVPDTVRRHLVRLFEQHDPAVRRGAVHVLQAVGLGTGYNSSVRRAEKIAGDRAADAEVRSDAIAFVALSNPPAYRTLFERLLTATEPEAVQLAVVRAIGQIEGEETGRFLLKNWRGLTTPVRLEAADALYGDPKRIPMVVTALKNGDIQPWTLAFRHRRQLIMHRDPAIRDAARPLLESAAGERAKIIAQYQPALERTGDASRGKTVFDSVCAKCHKLNGAGSDVGPDLGTVRHQPKQVLLTAILDPNESISQGFEAYVVETTSGATLDGVMGPQTPGGIVLKHEEGKQDVIQRKDIKSMYATNLSAMPADMEKQIDVQKMADLLEFVKSSR